MKTLNTLKKRHHTTKWWRLLICQRKSIQQKWRSQVDQREPKPNDKLEDNNEDAKKVLDRDDPPMVEDVMEDLTGVIFIEFYLLQIFYKETKNTPRSSLKTAES